MELFNILSFFFFIPYIIYSAVNIMPPYTFHNSVDVQIPFFFISSDSLKLIVYDVKTQGTSISISQSK